MSTNFWRLQWEKLYLSSLPFKKEFSINSQWQLGGTWSPLSLPKATKLLIQRRHTIEDSSTLLLKTKSIVELYIQTKPTLKLTSTSNARGAQDLAPKIKLQVTPLQKPSGAHGILFGTRGDFDNSLMDTFPSQSPCKALGFDIMSMMMTGTTSFEDYVANLTKIFEGLSTSLKSKDHEIKKLMNKLEDMN